MDGFVKFEVEWLVRFFGRRGRRFVFRDGGGTFGFDELRTSRNEII